MASIELWLLILLKNISQVGLIIAIENAQTINQHEKMTSISIRTENSEEHYNRGNDMPIAYLL